jgi:hypothetical protein
MMVFRNQRRRREWVVYGILRHFQQYFSYIVVVSFIGGLQLSPGSFKL